MIDWIDPRCKAWGRCTRWILADTGEGYPSSDTIAKANAGMLDATSRRSMTRHFGEVRLGEALEIARALATQPYMPLDLHATLWAHYVASGPDLKAKVRAAVLSRYLHQTVSEAEYWRKIDRAHHFLSARLTAPAQKPLDRCNAARQYQGHS